MSSVTRLICEPCSGGLECVYRELKYPSQLPVVLHHKQFFSNWIQVERINCCLKLVFEQRTQVETNVWSIFFVSYFTANVSNEEHVWMSEPQTCNHWKSLRQTNVEREGRSEVCNKHPLEADSSRSLKNSQTSISSTLRMLALVVFLLKRINNAVNKY